MLVSRPTDEVCLMAAESRMDPATAHGLTTRRRAAIERDGTEFFNDMIPLGRHGTAEKVARSVLYLASSQSRFATGSMLMVDGGMSA